MKRSSGSHSEFEDHHSFTLMEGLSECMLYISVIRTNFETLEQFPEEQALANEMGELLEESRKLLQRRLEVLREQVQGEEQLLVEKLLSSVNDDVVYGNRVQFDRTVWRPAADVVHWIPGRLRRTN